MEISIKELKEFVADWNAPAVPLSLVRLIGEPVAVIANGNFVGVLADVTPQIVTLKEARRVQSWRVANVGDPGLWDGVAQFGTTQTEEEGTRLSQIIGTIHLGGWVEIQPATQLAFDLVHSGETHARRD